jgi:hypothetical protein
MVEKVKGFRASDADQILIGKLRKKTKARNDSEVLRMSLESAARENGIKVPA